jgi:hypothetical protein
MNGPSTLGPYGTYDHARPDFFTDPQQAVFAHVNEFNATTNLSVP